MVKNLMTILVVVIAGSGLIFIAGCQEGAQSGTLLGTLIGAGVGQLAGGDTEATLIGAAVGGGAGYIFGNESDKEKTQTQIYSLRDEMDTVTVNVTNSNNSVSRVRLRKHGIGYVGTRGEYYAKLPTEDQLRPIYGF